MLSILGVARYQYSLDHAFAVGLAECGVAALFNLAARFEVDGFWDSLRCRLAGLGSFLWGVYLLLYGFQFTTWLLDIGFLAAALVLWLGRDRVEPLLGSVGIVAAIGVRQSCGEAIVLVFDLLMLAAVFNGGAHWVRDQLRAIQDARSLAKPAPRSPRRFIPAAIVFAILMVYAARPAWHMVNPAARRRLLMGLSPSFPVQDPASLSPLAKALRRHVVALSQEIGERDAYHPQAQLKAKDYVVARLREAGLEPESFEYRTSPRTGFERKEPCHNIEAILKAGPGAPGGTWIIGAHYDSAPGTPGADDNASGVAALLELAKLLKAREPRAEVRFVAFGTEEPPAFGTRDMGSYRYARDLKRRGVEVRALINLEMLGYYNPKPASQLFPPFLSLFYPGRGEFIGLVGNASSALLLGKLGAAWRRTSPMPLEMTILPSAFSTLALSDQLNFWHEGYKAVMFSDTSYFRYPHYHQAEDTAEKLDYERMAKVTQGLADVLSAL